MPAWNPARVVYEDWAGRGALRYAFRPGRFGTGRVRGSERLCTTSHFKVTEIICQEEYYFCYATGDNLNVRANIHRRTQGSSPNASPVCCRTLWHWGMGGGSVPCSRVPQWWSEDVLALLLLLLFLTPCFSAPSPNRPSSHRSLYVRVYICI